MTTKAERIEAIARAICAADKLAPDPDANVLVGMKTMKAWEARIPLAQAAIAADTVTEDVKRLVGILRAVSGRCTPEMQLMIDNELKQWSGE